MKRLLIILLLLFATQAWGATYYISKDAGNVGTKVCVDTTPWGTGTCNTTISAVVASKASGDIFVLDGGASGVTYTAAEINSPISLSNTNQTITSSANPTYSSSGHVGYATLDNNGGNYILYSNAKAGFVFSYLIPINSTGATGRGISGDSTGTIEYCKFRNNLYHVKAGSNSTTTTIRYNDFQGEATTAVSDIFLHTGTGTANVYYNTFRPYGSAGGGTGYGYGGAINIQGTGTYNIYNNVFAGCRTATVSPFSTNVYTLNYINNIAIGCGAGNTATGAITSATGGSTFTSTNNYFGISAVAPATPENNADSSSSNLYGSSPLLYAKSSRIGYVTFSIDDFNVAQDTWAYIYGTDGSDGLATLIQSAGGKLTWYVPTGDAVLQTDYLVKLAWAKAHGVEIGLHTRSQSSLSLADATKIWDTSGNVTIDRTADTITTAGGAVSGFKAKTLKAIKLELEAAPHSLTVTPAALYNAYASGSVNELAMGEILKDSGPGTEVLLKVTDHTAGLFKAEIVDALAELEAISGIGAGTVKSFSYPYSQFNAGAKAAILSAGLTSSRISNIDTASSQHISNLDRYIIGMFNNTDVKANTTSGDATDDIRSNINGLMGYLCETGSIVDIHSHNATELSLAQWATVLAEIVKWNGKVTYTMSLSEAITDIMSFATDDGDGTLSYTWPTETPDYRLLPTSPAINAGTDVCATLVTATDYRGRSVCVSSVFNVPGMTKPAIGAYQPMGIPGQVGPGGGMGGRMAPYRIIAPPYQP